jgi:adenosylcobinamide kinase/adenosylcobinamide-phosphate guanylyltransferase
LSTLEAPVELAKALRSTAQPDRLVVIDCLTLWLTNLLMPLGDGDNERAARPWPHAGVDARFDALVDAIGCHEGSLVIVSNEIGLGVTPASASARRFVDELGRLHQRIATACERVTLMVAGIEVAVKAPS